MNSQIKDSGKAETATIPDKTRELSGKGIVIAMFLLGGLATAGLWFYWHYHYAPFRPLQDAIVAEFPGSAPRVEGGRRKMHKNTPKTLRITLKVEFDPTVDAAQAESVAQQLEKIIRRNYDISTYDKLEMYLFQKVPEREYPEKLIERDLTAAHAQ